MELDPATILEHDAKLRRLARALVRDEAAADDAVQKAWLAALKERGRARSPLAWLSGAVRNLLLERFRSEARRTRREVAEFRSDSALDTAEIVAREELRRRVFESVMALDEPFRRTMLLRYFEDLPPREIARREGAPIDTVNGRLKRGSELLRRSVSSDEPEPRRRSFLVLVPFAARAPLDGLAALSLPMLSGIAIMSMKTKLAVAAVAVAIGSTVMFMSSSPPEPNAGSDAANSIADSQDAPVVANAERDSTEAIVVARESAATPSQAPAVAATNSRLATLEVRVLFAPERAPARDVTIKPFVYGAAAGTRSLKPRRSDAAGVVRFTELQPGDLTILSDRGGYLGVDLAPGENQVQEFVIEEGALLRGIVRDSRGQPFSGASIFLSQQMAADGSVVATTGADGRFAVRNVSSLHYIGARADGFAPSELKLVMGSVGAEHELEFVLGTEGGTLRGKVIGSDGQPLAHAEVVFDPQNRGAHPTYFGHDTLNAIPQTTESDESGAFEFLGLPSGPFEVKARAPEHAPVTERVEIVPGGTARTVIRLPRCGRLVGTVRDSSGKAVRNATIANGYYVMLESFLGRTDAGGEFAIDEMPVGEQELKISSDAHAETRVTAFIVSGRDTRIDIVLENAGMIRGQVVDAAGQPLASVAIEGAPELNIDSARMPVYGETDADGNFALAVPLGQKWTLSFRVPPCFFFASHVERGVPSDRSELRITIPPERIPRTTLVGRVLGPEGNPIAGARVTVAEATTNTSPLISTLADGRFTFGPVPTGTYTILVEIDGFPQQRSTARKVDLEDVCDFGDIALVTGQRLELRVSWVDVLARNTVFATIEPLKGGPQTYVEITGERGRSGLLPPGSYRVSVTGEGIAATVAECTLEAGKEAALDLVLTPGYRREFSAIRASGDTRSSLHFFIDDATGRIVANSTLSRSVDGATYRGVLSLAPGAYVGWFEIENGKPERFDFSVDAHGDPLISISAH